MEDLKQINDRSLGFVKKFEEYKAIIYRFDEVICDKASK
jgi:hypothetical protein